MMPLLVYLCLFALGARADQIFIDGFTRYFWPSSAVNQAVTRLYIDGGEVYTGTTAEDNTIFNALNVTLCIDISQSWSSNSISLFQVTQAQKPIQTQTFPLSRRPVLWYSNSTNKLYSWAGWGYGSAPQGLWELALTNSGIPNGMWTEGPAPNAAITPTWASAYATIDGNMYSLGGVAQLSATYPTPGLVESVEASGEWTNTTAPAQSSGAFGQAIAAPSFGTEGVIVYIGGEALSTLATVASYADTPLQDMSNIYVYDVGTKQFYAQKADGNVPLPKQGFCAAMVTNADGSIDIFMHAGGEIGDSATSQQNVHVLSVPAFRWTELPNTSQPPRFNPTCQVIGKRQMVVIGGWGATGDISDEDRTPDPYPNGIALFDMVALSWSSNYDANAAPYERPGVLATSVGGRMKPTTWSDPNLARIFRITTSPTPPALTPNSRPSSDKSVIIGGVVGGVVALIVIGMAAWCIVRRRNSRSRQTQKYSSVQNGLEDTDKGHGVRQELAELPDNAVPGWELDSGTPPTKKAVASVSQGAERSSAKYADSGLR